MGTVMTNVFRRFLPACALVAVAGAPLASSAKETAPDPAQTVSAVTKTQEIDFYYQSFTTYYSCHSLEDRVRQLLLALGADKNMKVKVASCFGNEIARFPNVRIQMSSPVEATPEVLAELEKTRSTRELTARVRGEPMVEVTAQYPAYWKPVSLSRGSFRLEPGDCELVDQLKRKVMPKLAVRIVKDDLSCTPNQASLGQPRLEVEALTRAPEPDAAGASGEEKKQ